MLISPGPNATVSLEQSLERITAITLQIQQTAHLEGIFTCAVYELRELLQLDRVLIYDRATQAIAAESSAGDWPALKGQILDQRHWQDCSAPGVWSSTCPTAQSEALRQMQVQSELIVPILAAGGVWGVLIAQHCQVAHTWHPLEKHTCQQIALHLGSALERQQLRGQFCQPNQIPLELPDPVDPQLAGIWQEQEDRFQALIANMPGMVYRFFPKTAECPARCTFVSTYSYELFEISPAVICQDINTLIGLIHPEDLPGFIASIDYVVQNLLPWFWEGRVLTPSGKLKWIRGNSQVQQTSEGPAWDGFLIDISDRKLAEVALQRQTQRTQGLNRVVQAIRNSLDLPTIFATATAETAHLLEVERVQVVRYVAERRCWRMVASHHAPELFDTVGLEIPEENNPLSERLKQFQVVLVEDTGGLTDQVNQAIAQILPGAWVLVPIVIEGVLWGSFTVNSIHRPFTWTAQQVELVQSVADQLAIAIQQSELYDRVRLLNTNLEQQIDERTLQLQQLLNFEALLKRITDSVRDSLDEQHILQTAVNELARGLNVLGCDTGIYNAEQTSSTIVCEARGTLRSAQGQTFAIAEACHPDVYPQLLRGEVCQCCEIAPVNFRDENQTFAKLACPLRDDQGVLGDLWLLKAPDSVFSEAEVRLVQQVANQCAIALRQSRLYQAVQHQVEELERLNRLKDDFLSTVSHELRSPMASIKMAIHMLEIRLQALGLHQDAKLNRYMQILHQQCQRESSLINDLLDLTRLDTSSEPLNLTSISLQQLIPLIVTPFLERMQEKQQYLDIVLPSDLPDMFTELSYLERSLVELLHNACKYTPVNETIRIAVKLTANVWVIEVSNTGVDISEQQRHRVFDKFYRIPNNDPWKHGGTGLGLALVKKMIERLQGTIGVSSQPNLVTFTLQLPCNPLGSSS